MKKKILIPYASYGTGHKAVGLYIKNYFESLDKELEILPLDLLQYSIPIIGKASQSLSNFLMQRLPTVWNFIYNIFDNKYNLGISNKLSMAMFKNKKLKKTIQDFNPDLTISTHFFGSSLLANYNKKGICNSKVITVVTDYEAHEFWLQNHKSDDYIIVADKNEVAALVKRGVEKKKIKAIGIPIAPTIPSDFNKEKALKSYGLSGENKVCLFFGGGGNGTKIIIPYIKKILKMKLNLKITFDFIFIAGKNTYVKNKVEKWVKDYKIPGVKVFGWVTNGPELFELCDFVVTKPGGAQTTEALYFKKPAVFIVSTGGQENANHKYFTKNGYGRRFKTAYGFSRYIETLNNNPKMIDKMHQKMISNNNDKAMENLYELTTNLLKK